jgi:dipeptidyl aminopeptidase/acylaminoacyl peptidase
MRGIALLCLLLLGLAASYAAQPPAVLPVATFFKKANIAQLTFSPDGKRMACLIPYERRMNLAVIDLDKKSKALLTNFKDNDVGSVLWASNDRLIFTKDTDGQEWSSVFAINRDGKDGVMLASGAGEAGTGREANQQFRGLLARLPHDPKHILVLGNLTAAQGPDVCRMNLQTGRMTLEVENPGWVRRWVLDRDRRVRLGVAQEGQTVTVLLRNLEKGTWETLQTRQTDQPGWSPLGFDGDNRTLFVASNVGRKTTAVYRYDIQTRTLGALVFGDDVYDAENIIYDEARHKVVAVAYQADRERFHWLDAEAEALQKKLDASLPDTVNVQRHAAPDGSRRLIFSSSDRDPGVYYLFDQAAKKLDELAVVKPGIDPERMAAMKPVTFQARDGVTLHGYLTLPVGREAKKLPLILHPHGGPFGIRDQWSFNPEVQFYANRGYAVLQVKYRGSGGYGDPFERLGWKKWGLEMQDDLSDGVKWAIAQGIADPDRVVIAGASYGGYATMAGLVFTPELYCAGINYVGVVDIDELVPRGESTSPERAYWYATRIGDVGNAADRKRIHDTSPVHFADRIRAPLLMAYGKNDPRVRISQGFDIQAALKKAGKPFEMIIQEDEGHGFRKEELSIAFFTRVDAFLKTHVQKVNVKVGPSQVIEMPARPKS